jgi:hypothetical protein
LTACAGNSAASRQDGPTSANAPATAKSSSADGGSSAADGGDGDGRQFAGSAAEATSMISDAVDKKSKDMQACVREFRARKKIERARVMLSIGIDQEGKVLGVTTKGKEDAELKACVQTALKDASFPRSHAGVITLTKTYEEILQ